MLSPSREAVSRSIDQVRLETSGLQIGIHVGDLGHICSPRRSFCDHVRSSRQIIA
jgi:hypothetical protein